MLVSGDSNVSGLYRVFGRAKMEKNVATNAIVQEVLMVYNYPKWKTCIENYLLGQDLWEVIQSETKPEENDAKFKIWRKKNAMALHAIQISCGSDVLSQIWGISTARETWNFLANMYNEQLSQRSVLSPDPTRKPRTGKGVVVDHRQFLNACSLIRAGSWDALKDFLDQHPEALRGTTKSGRGTILHVAVISGKAKIVEELVHLLSEEDLEIENFECWTALTAAAAGGYTQMVECMVKKNKNLVCVADNCGMIPIVRASAKAHTDTVRYLFSVTPLEILTPESGPNGATLLCNCIVGNMFDIAFNLLRRCPRLAVTLSHIGVSPVFTLSQMPSAFPSGSSLVFWQRWIYSRIDVEKYQEERMHGEPASTSDINFGNPRLRQLERVNSVLSAYGKMRGLVRYLVKFAGINQIYDIKVINVLALAFLCLAREELKISSDQLLRTASIDKAIFQAVKNGCIEFVMVILGTGNPYLLRPTDMNGRNIFMCAVVYRQEKIFSIMDQLDPMVLETWTSQVDRFNNNILHLAGMLAPSGRLDNISGAALQMQRELQWFKKVESMVHPRFKEDLNLDGKTPHELFTEQHMDLMKEGETWMKDTATSCTVVAALIVTITFAAAFTVPGGNNGDTGFPIFLGERLFMVFMVSDAISFFSSSTSILLFLEILTSRYGEEYFLESLPRMMVFGLTTFFLSIATMMIAFCGGLFLMLRGQSWWVIASVNLLAGVPVSLFIFSKFPLLIEILFSTYGPSIFNKSIDFGSL